MGVQLHGGVRGGLLVDKPNIMDAPFSDYLAVLRELGRDEDADITEAFYVETLTQFGFTREDIMKTPFKNLEAAMVKILEEAERNLEALAPQPFVTPQNMYVGKGADGLSEAALNRLASLQQQITDEEKIRLSMGR